jgi:hypothetical protein
LDGGHFRLYDPAHDATPIYETAAKPDGSPPMEEAREPAGSAEFAYEADLRNYLAKNLSIIEPGLKLYQDEEITGVEFDVGGRRIDILAIDAKGALVVIELKVSRGYDRVVGQLMRYMAWIRKNQAEPGQQVRGVIVAREISEDLLLACSLLPGVRIRIISETEVGEHGRQHITSRCSFRARSCKARESSMRMGILGSGLMGGKLGTVYAKTGQAMIRCRDHFGRTSAHDRKRMIDCWFC